MFGNNKIMEVVEFVWENRDHIMELIERLPQILKETGDNIESAGNSAMKTSLFLAGGKGHETNASDLSDKAALALGRAYEEIQEVAKVMAVVGEELGDLRIPSIEPEYREVFGAKVIAGLDIGKTNPLATVSTRLSTGSKRLGKLSDEMEDVSASLKKLSGVLTDVGGDLHEMGLKLTHSGKTLTQVADFGSFGERATPKKRDSGDDDGGFSVKQI